VQSLRRCTLHPPCRRRHPQTRRWHRHHRSVKAKGRKDIVDSCPYGAIVWNDEQQVPQTWIFDAHLLDQGWDRPRCQQSCPTDVFEAVKLDDVAMKKRAAKEGLKVLKPDLGTNPRLVPGLERQRFVGGSVSADVAGRWNASRGEVTLSQGGKFSPGR
jgi:Fe-S-cluster-containing dehydrogenase component